MSENAEYELQRLKEALAKRPDWERLWEEVSLRAETAEARIADLERDLAEARARVLALEGALRPFLRILRGASHHLMDGFELHVERSILEAARAVLAGDAMERLLHVKSGHLCTVLYRSARLQTGAPLSDMEPMVVYEHDGNIWVRPESEFNDGRFVPIADAKGDDNA